MKKPSAQNGPNMASVEKTGNLWNRNAGEAARDALLAKTNFLKNASGGQRMASVLQTEILWRSSAGRAVRVVQNAKTSIQVAWNGQLMVSVLGPIPLC